MEKQGPVRLILINGFAPVTSGGYVVERTRIFDT
jgi:hypothetical protein